MYYAQDAGRIKKKSVFIWLLFGAVLYPNSLLSASDEENKMHGTTTAHHNLYAIWQIIIASVRYNNYTFGF